MEEKKLTDEDIAKAFECCNTIGMSCNDCPFEKNGDECVGVERITLDLIQRLQEKNERLKEVNAGLALANLCDLPPNEDCLTDNEFEVARKTIAEQKAEIANIRQELAKELAEHEEFTKQAKAEIERLTKESYEIFDRHAKENKVASILIEQRNNEIAELQKQVDKLKEERENMSDEIFSLETMLQQERIEKKRLRDAFLQVEKQTVKDTAKEIYSEINSCIEQGQDYCGLDWRGLLTAKTMILVWCKKNGVEVE